MTNRTKKIYTWFATGIAALLIIMIAMLKLLEFSPLVEIYLKIGLRAYIQLLGITLLIFLALFLWSRTMKIGFLLLTGYFGGAMAVELSNGVPFVFPATILVMIWISAFLRDATIFKTSRVKEGLATSIRRVG